MQTLDRTPKTEHHQDWLLLRRYVEQNSQDAFAALVARHLKLVYATCRREVGDMGLAEDVTQVVFLILAKKAPSLRPGTHLAGWLFQTARFAAKNARTTEQRRARYEQEAAQMTATNQATQDNALWNSLEPALNDAVAHLSTSDREAILLRYWSDQSLAEIGTEFGVSEDTARKRVARAVEKLRMRLGKQGVLISGAALAALLSVHAARAAPASLAPAIAQTMGSAAMGQAGAHLTSSSIPHLTQGVLHAMKIAQIKTTVLIAATSVVGLTACAGAARYASLGNPSPGAQIGQPGSDASTQVVSQPISSNTTMTPQQITQQSQKAYDALRSYQATVTVTSDGIVGNSSHVSEQITANVKFVRPGKIRVDAAVTDSSSYVPPGDQFALVSDGNTTKCLSVGMGWNKSDSVEDAAGGLAGVTQRAATYLPIILTDSSMINPLTTSHAYNPSVQEASVDGAPCYVVTFTDVTSANSWTTTLWIDKKSFLLRRLVDDSSGTVTTPLTPDAVKVQSHEEQVFSGEKINAPISDSTFVVPV